MHNPIRRPGLLVLPLLLALLAEVRANQPIVAGLIGYWKLDETSGSVAVDSSGRGNAGVYGWVSGVGGFLPRSSANHAPLQFSNPASLEFDGITGFVEAPPAPFDAVTDTFTMSFWARPSAERGGGWQQRCAVYPRPTVVGGVGYEVGVSIGTNGIALAERRGTFPTTFMETAMVIGDWTHVTVVYENRVPRLWMNGTLIATGDARLAGAHPGSCIAGGSDQAFGPYAGLLDDVRIYDRALSDAEISALASGREGVDYGPPGAVTLWAGFGTRSSLTVSWVAPADDGQIAASGPAAEYDLRYSTDGAISTSSAFDAANRAPISFPPGTPGLTQLTVVEGLHAATTYWFCMRTLDHAGTWSSRSTNVSTRTADDAIPPGAVTDLRVERIAPVTLRLTWTAPADDAGLVFSGAVSGYDLRCSDLGPIVDDATFAAARSLDAPPAGAVPGSMEFLIVDGLRQATEYHFAIRARDYQPNWSALSNSPSAVTGFPGSAGAGSPCHGAASGRSGWFLLALLPALAFFRRI